MPSFRTINHRLRPSSRAKVDLALLVNQSHALDHHAELLQQLKDAGGSALIIWPSHPGRLQGSLQEAKDSLEALGNDVAVTVMSPRAILRDFRRGRIGALLTQTPFLTDHYAPEFTAVFTTVPLIYLGYGLDVFSGYLSTSSELLSRFTFILAANPHHAARLIGSGIAREKVLLFGHPSAHRLRRQLAPHHLETPTILWQPHWTREFSTWERALPVILRLARSRPDVHVRLSPHPLLEALTGLKLPSGYDQATLQDSTTTNTLTLLCQEPNVTVTRGPLLKDIVESDICVTDGKAMIGFFGITGKPMAVSKSTERRADLLPEYRSLANHWTEEGSPERIEVWLNKILDEWSPGMKSAEAIAAGDVALPTFEPSPGAALLRRLRGG